MASEWPVVSLGEVINLKRGYDLAAREREHGSVPIVSSSGVSGLHSIAMAQAPGVVTGRYGTIGLVHYVETPYWPLNTTLYVQDFKGNDPRFIYYLLKTISYRDYLDKAAVPGINRNDVHQALVSLPPVAQQCEVAAILTSLDKQIERIQGENKTLESIARAIFKSWFVDFDPVRAKVEGREPEGMDAAAAALFPGSLIDTELGEMPDGWSTRRLGDVADVNWGDTNATKSRYSLEGFPAYSASGADGFMPDFMFDRTGIVVSAIGANCGATWLALGKWSCIKNTLRLWATDKSVSTEFLFYATRRVDLWPKRGSAQPFISQGDARKMAILVPANNLAERFGEMVGAFHKKMEINRGLMDTLADLRDTLLPRLISGKLRIPEAEKLVKAVL